MSYADNTSVPVPPDISPPVDPFFELLAAFPVPKLLATSALSGRGDAACDTTHASDDHIAKTVLESARVLMASGGYRILRHAADNREGESSNGRSSKIKSGVSQLSPLARRIHEGLLRMEVDHVRDIDDMKTIEASSKNIRWLHNTERHMVLRPRCVLQATNEKEKEKKIVKVPKLEPKPGTPVSVVLPDAEPASAQQKTESYCFSTVVDIVDKGLQDARSLESLVGMLSGTSQPFKNISADRLTAFVSSLATPPEETAAEVVIHEAVMQRAVTCCAVLAHPSFEPSILAEDTVDHLVTILAAVVRRVTKRQMGHALDGASTSTELECLRAMLKCFAVMVCDTRLNVCAHGDLMRLEDLCFQCLFVITNICGRQEVENYAAYVLSHALYLYRCLWNRLELERDATCQRFFPRLPLSNNLLQRLYPLLSGVKTMTLTPAVVVAVQSVPLSTSTSITRNVSERIQRQCRVWSSLLVQHFFLYEKGDKKERDLCGAVVLQFCEDLAHLIALPEYPIADMFLRSLFVSLAQYCFHFPGAEGLRSLFVDAVFRVSCVIFSPYLQTLLQSVLPDSCALTTTQLQQWHDLTHPDKTERDVESPLFNNDMRHAVLYMALSRFIADPAPDVAFTFFHTRAAHILTWDLYCEGCFSESALGRLVHAKHLADISVAVEWDVLHACNVQLCAASDMSLLSPMAKERLLGWLLSVFQLREEQHIAGLDAVRTKVLRHVAKLTELHSPLLDKIWPIARCCVRDDNARVREAIIPLLLTLLLKTCSGGNFSVRAEETAVDVISSLLHLLHDRSVVVITRALVAFETLLTEMPFRSFFETTAVGENLLTFTESKLLEMMGLAKESRHQACVVRIFLRRWVRHETAEVATHGANAQVARELMRLTVTNTEYPYEMSESLHLVTLLRGMCRVAEQQGTSKRPMKHAEVDCQELRGVMIGVTKMLWTEHQRLTPAREATAALAAIHAVAMVCSEWVEPLLEVLVQVIVEPIPTQSSSLSSQAGNKEAIGVTLLHVCQILRTVLLAPQAPPLSLDPLARAVTVLLSRYVGPYQHHILFSASGVLTAAITCGCNKLTKHVNLKYLTLCYSLMNTYYMRVMALIPSLCTDLQSVAYTLRFLFLLSGFLRLYPGWKYHREELTEETAVGRSGVPNQLACGDGICANVYTAVEQVLHHCPEESQTKMSVIAMRVFSSLCILQPTVFFRRCESRLHCALDPEADVSLQTQGLVFIRDFLKDEDTRIDYATSMNAPVPAPSSSSSSASSSPPTERRRMKRDELRIEALPHVEEQNSGMATWVMQQFHVEVLQLCESSSLAVRQLAFEVLQLCAEGGLLPPSRYASALMVLAADPQSEKIRKAAVECIASQGERYADIIAASAATGVVKAFNLHHACGVDVLQSAIFTNTISQKEECIHAHLFAILRKRHRDALLSSLLRYFHHEGRALQWLRDHSNIDAELVSSPFLFMGHLIIVVAHIPYVLESDVLQVLDSCRAAVDMVGQSCLDFMEAQQILLESNKQTPSRAKRQKTTRGNKDAMTGQELTVEVWRCFGVVCLLRLRSFLCREYALRGARLKRLAMRRSTGTSTHGTTLAHREPQSAASVAFRQSIGVLVQSAAPLCEVPIAAVCRRRRAVEELRNTLLNCMREIEVEEETDDKETNHGGSNGVQGKTKGLLRTPSARIPEESAERRQRQEHKPQQQQRRRQCRRQTSVEEKEEEEDQEKTVLSSSRLSLSSSSVSSLSFSLNVDAFGSSRGSSDEEGMSFAVSR